MKDWILFLVIGTLLIGWVTADTGIAPVSETQDLTTQTVVRAFGMFSHTSEMNLAITDDAKGLNGIPPLEDSSSSGGSIDVISYEPLIVTAGGVNRGAVYYAAVCTEDTQTNGLGEIGYAKNLGITTKAMATGQSNIEAVKQIAYTGEPGGKILSNDFISVDGAGNPSTTARFGLGLNTEAPAPDELASDKLLCPCNGGSAIPAFCNHVESASSIDMNIANVGTTMNTRFIVPSSDTPVSLNNNIRVSDSIGKVSAGIDVNIREGANLDEDIQNFNAPIEICTPGGGCTIYEFDGWFSIIPSNLAEEVNMHEFTSADGSIVSFRKSMSYTSGNLR